MRALFASTLCACACVALVPIGACSDTPPGALCKDIPAGGCPLGHGVACDDPLCAAVYACSGGSWSLDHVCAPRDGGVDASPPDARPPRDADIDAPPGAFGGPGCADLQPPDCSLGSALACSSGCCECADLYVCVDAGWAPWGVCTDDGGITPR